MTAHRRRRQYFLPDRRACNGRSPIDATVAALRRRSLGCWRAAPQPRTSPFAFKASARRPEIAREARGIPLPMSLAVDSQHAESSTSTRRGPYRRAEHATLALLEVAVKLGLPCCSARLSSSRERLMARTTPHGGTERDALRARDPHVRDRHSLFTLDFGRPWLKSTTTFPHATRARTGDRRLASPRARRRRVGATDHREATATPMRRSATARTR